ncbi:hypothetical protein [Streptomyces tsukubensis]|uniref:hypothetical protein n=1 Tax=Streptomyces tsukubensis TaxID=83656 RepID=UPI003450FBE7
MTDSAFNYRQAHMEAGAACADARDLWLYMHRVAMDAQSLRMGVGEAVAHVFPGFTPPSDELGGDLPNPMERVERALFDDVMGAGIRITDPALATALRHTMRLLENTADATDLVRSLLDQPEEPPEDHLPPARTNQDRPAAA